MTDILTDLKYRYRTGSILLKYIYINVGIFAVILLATVVLRLFNLQMTGLEYLQVPSSAPLLLHRPWTLFTYMFVHYDFLHILFNMLWLYWFGRIFMMFFNGRQLGGLYVLGGFAGALLFFVSYNVFPYFRYAAESSFLVGASASVMAIVFAVSFYRKDYEINLLFLGRVKLSYLAVAVLLLDVLAITSENAGGHIAHVGGALLGILFAYEYRKGKDITNFMNRLIDKFVNIFRNKPTFRINRPANGNSAGSRSRAAESDDEYHRRKNAENAEIDAILDKLKWSGYESLSAEEKKKLFDASRK